MMTPCTLADLPPPPPGCSGWPWDEATDAPPATLPDGKPWPRISIITPSYNQAQYIEETIRSILLQGYPELEYFIIDGGSNDHTVEILRKYEPWLSGWVSERDSGQSEAINKGFSRCSGEIFNWMCSDDFLTKGALAAVAEEFVSGDGCDVLAGACFCQYDDEPEKNSARSGHQAGWVGTPYIAGIWQPSCYFRSDLVRRPELVSPELHYCMDRELWCYFFRSNARWKWTEKVLSHYRFTGANKSVTGRDKVIDEIARIFKDHESRSKSLPALLRKIWLPLVLAGKRHSSRIGRFVLREMSRAVSMILLLVYPREQVRALQNEFYVYSVW